MDKVDLKIMMILLLDRIQLKTTEKRLNGSYCGKAANDERRDPIDEPGLKVCDENRNEKHNAQNKEDHR